MFSSMVGVGEGGLYTGWDVIISVEDRPQWLFTFLVPRRPDIFLLSCF